MNVDFPSRQKIRDSFILSARRLWQVTAVLAGLFVVCGGLQAQEKSVAARPHKLQSPDKIVGDYLKAVGGRKRVAGIKDASYEWAVQLKTQPAGRAEVRHKAPTSSRIDLILGDGEVNSASSSRSAWRRGTDLNLRTLTDAEAGAAKLQAALDASYLVDYKRQNVLARTVSVDETLAEPASVVEFSTKAGARLRYWFGTTSHLLLKTVDEARGITTYFSDYRTENGVSEPHRLEVRAEGRDALTFLLQGVRYNTGVSDAVFDPPAAETPDIAKLLREVEENQKRVDERVSDYSFTEKLTERKVNDKGEVTEEKVTVYEVFPLPGGGIISKIISENGVPLSPERAAKQDKKIAEDVARHEAERQKREQKQKEAEEKNKEQERDDDDDDKKVTVATFLRACEFISPRRERLRDREAVVFDFRPRAGFKPKTTAENVVAKLAGVLWIDPVDKEVIRLEAKLAESFKVGGGVFASIRPGSSFTAEQTRMADGVWLPLFAQFNFSAKFLLFKKIEANRTHEFSDYRRFKTEASDYKLSEPPATNNSAPPKP